MIVQEKITKLNEKLQAERLKLQSQIEQSHIVIENYKQILSDCERQLIKVKCQIEYLQEMTLTLESSPRDSFFDEELIRTAKEIIENNNSMKRVRKIINVLISKGYKIHEPNLIAKKLLSTGKFKINAKTKCWECVEKNNLSKVIRCELTGRFVSLKV